MSIISIISPIIEQTLEALLGHTDVLLSEIGIGPWELMQIRPGRRLLTKEMLRAYVSRKYYVQYLNSKVELKSEVYHSQWLPKNQEPEGKKGTGDPMS